MKLVICTFNRSEYGLLRTLIDIIDKDDFFSVQLLVGGAHLKSEYGFTKQEILNDGFQIDCEIDYLPNSTSPDDLLKSTGKLIEELSDYLKKKRPEACLVLGDRYELLPVSYACLMTGTLLFHISGGEVTEGAIDNQVRHAVTKIANLHFVSNEVAKKNVLKMGEEDWRICVSGEPGLDFIHKIPQTSKSVLFNSLNLNEDLRLFLCTFHPETIDQMISPDAVEELFRNILEKYPDCQILATAANSDPGGLEINQKLADLNGALTRYRFIPSLGQIRYYSVLQYTDLLLGNTSSGIVEAQSFYVPVINVGNRQKGRDQNINTLNLNMDQQSIIRGIERALAPQFLEYIKTGNNIYGDGHSSLRIVSFIKEVMQNKTTQDLLLKKSIF